MVGKLKFELTDEQKEEIFKFATPRQVIKTRWLRITWKRSRMRGSDFAFTLWLPRRQISRSFRLQLEIWRLCLVLDRIKKEDWHPEERRFWLPLPEARNGR